MTDLKHFPRIIGREYKRKRSTKAMAAVTGIIVLAIILILSAIKGEDQAGKVNTRDMRGACKHSANMWLAERD